MYSRADRRLNTVPGFKAATKSHVGPGTYKAKPVKKYAQKDTFAPFGSMNGRDNGSLFAESTHKGPKPDAAQYNVVQYEADFGVGGSSLQNRSRRFTGDDNNVPDPGAYEVRGTMGKKYKGKKYTGQNANKPHPRVSYTRRNNAAAIPSRHEVLGYEEDPHTGELKKADAGLASLADLGPGSHNVPDPAALKSEYGGINFGVRSSNRKLKTTIAKEGPAPGSYTMGHSRQMESSTKMRKAPTTLIGTAVRKMNPSDTVTVVPSPNSYLMPPSFKAAVKPAGMQNFGSSVNRFGGDSTPTVVKNRTPGPGAYEEKRTAIRIRSNAAPGEGLQSRRPFNQSAARFTEPLKAKLTPAPVAYDVESWQAGAAGVDITVQASANVAGKGAFGSTAPRPDPHHVAAKKQQGSAAPGEYNSGKSNPTPSTLLMNQKQSSAFKSQTTRMKKVAGYDAPPPNSYYAAESHAALNATTGLRPGDASKAFNTQQGRFDPATSTQREKLAVHNNPSPSSYEFIAGKTRAVQFDAAKRFHGNEKTSPSPNRYTLHGRQESTFKPTYNVTLSGDHANTRGR